MPASSPGLTSSSSTVEAALLGPAHLHPQDHLRPVLGVGAAGAGVDRHERVARVVGARRTGAPPRARAAAASTESSCPSSSRASSSSSSASSTSASRSSTSAATPRKVSRRRVRRACSAPALAAASASSQNPGSPICVSSAAMRSASDAGSKIVREQLKLVANRRETRRRRLGSRTRWSCAVAALELLARAAPAGVVAPELLIA